MSLNYAETWQPELLEILNQETLCSPFITSNVTWLGAKTFHFTQMSTSGFKSHSRSGGWNRGTYAQLDNEYTVQHDRDVEFLVDKADVDETNSTASIQNIAKVFQQTQSAPEKDALFFSKVATKAKTLTDYHSSTAASDYTAANVFGKLKGFLSKGKLRRYRGNGALIMYVTSAIMDLLEQSTQFNRVINIQQVADGGIGIETRVTDIDGVSIMEIIDDDRFYDSFDFTNTDGGFVPYEAAYAASTDTTVDSTKTYYTRSGSSGAYTYTAVSSPTGNPSTSSYYERTQEPSHKINVLIATPMTTKLVSKIESIYYFAPGAHTQGDGWLFQDRDLSDVFVFPNGKDNKIDSIYVDIDTAEYTEE